MNFPQHVDNKEKWLLVNKRQPFLRTQLLHLVGFDKNGFMCLLQHNFL